MKKKIVSLALVALSLVGIPAVAQTAASTPAKTCTEAGVCSKDGEVCKKGKDGKACDKTRKAPKCDIFEGLNLTDAQKEQFKQLGEKRKAEAQARKEQKQAADSAARTARKDARKSHLADIKAILTPEQYVLFLENSYLNQGAPRKGVKGVSPRHGKKDGKDAAKRQGGKKGPKTPRQAQPAQAAS